MNKYQAIIDKLERFIKKYYVNELLKGIILFAAIGLLYFLLTVFLEWLLWLGPLARTILFWLFIIVEVSLFSRFIIYPLTKLFKLSKGITYEEASAIIGEHFQEVNDKLLNILQLQRSTDSSELLLASIDQKAEELQPIQFNFAVNFRRNTTYLKYLAIPVFILLVIWISGSNSLFSESYKRVVNYQQAYEPPAPFQFFVVNKNLDANQNEDFTIEVRTTGSIIPQETSIHYNNETYFMKPVSAGVFQYTFKQLSDALTFRLSANEVNSKPYTINVTKVPTLLNFKMNLDYPSYTGRRDEIIKGTGSATIPEGTRVTWTLHTQNTSNVSLITADTTTYFSGSNSVFQLDKQIIKSLDYQVSTSNENLQNYENLAYALQVVKDQYPELVLKSELDSIDNQSMYFFGSASDDYGLSKLELVFYPSEDQTQVTKIPIDIAKSTYDDFVYAFPDTLSLAQGVSYDFYFQVLDNDRVNGSKRTKSKVFNFRRFTNEELEKQQLEEQKETISEMNKSLQKLKQRDKELEEINKLQKEKKNLNYSDKKKLNQFLKRQQQQEKLMQEYSRKMKENLKNFQKDTPNNDPVKNKLEERYQKNEEQLKKNEELLKELQEIQDKINKEELSEKLEKLAKQNQNEEKNLEQLLELTKRYYVEKKALKLADELDKLAKKQEELSKDNTESNNAEKQKELNEEFEQIQRDMEELQKENEKLKEPMSIPNDKNKQEQVKTDQEEATEKLEEEQNASSEDKKKEQKSNAQEKQKNAAEKMKEMSQDISSQMEQSGKEGLTEDAEMLRQILDNLVTFSFEQENLMEQFKNMERNNPSFAKKLRRQSVLRENFMHIDDSLYALALRSPEIGEVVNEKLTDIEFNIDKSIERLADNLLSQGIGNQQYTVTRANELAYLLAQSLDNMQASMKGASGSGKSGKSSSGKGQGSGKGFQLPDIIKKQEELGNKLEKGMKSGSKPGQGESGDGQSEDEGQGNKGNGNKNNSGDNGEGRAGDKQLNEEMSGMLFKIYQEQQELRNQLEDLIQEQGLGTKAEKLSRQMRDVENSLLDKGFDNEVLRKMANLQHQLMKLDDATLQQGEDVKRESRTNRESFSNPRQSQVLKAKEYFNTTEILNRQTLPLRQNFRQKVQDYFKSDD